MKTIPYTVTCGVPRGSVLGPTLWNEAYDIVLRSEMSLPPQTSLIAFTDDLAVVVRARYIDDIEARAATAVRRLTAKLQRLGLELASHKTEMVILAERRKHQELEIALNDDALNNTTIIKSKSI